MEETLLFQCPWCGEDFEVLAEMFDGAQSYIEDCQVCCHPIAVALTIADGEVVTSSAERA